VAERLPIVAVVGDGIAPHPDLARPLGAWLARQGFHLLTGGGSGVMETVSRAFCEVSPRRGLAIGVIPGVLAGREGARRYRTKSEHYPNPWVEIPIYTHLPGEDPRGLESRNHVNVLTADAVVALPGGVGTASEIELAREYGKPLILFLDGGTIHGRGESELREAGFRTAARLDEVASFLREALGCR
jgi:uncharacterized protein (TIGR00725 family)